MNQPPNVRSKPPQWRRPQGVAAGTWDYVHERSIADRYDRFVEDTPLCELDLNVLGTLFPLAKAKESSPEILLDLGCGSGRASIFLANRGYEVVSIDLSQAMLSVAARKAGALSSGRLMPLRANLVQLDCLQDSIANHAFCLFSTLGMIQGRSNRRAMLTHVTRLIQPDGRLLIHVHNRWAAVRERRGIVRLLKSWIQSRRNPQFEFGDHCYAYRGIESMFMHRFSRSEVVDDLKQTGWEIERVLSISIDGSKSYDATPWNSIAAGGFFVIGRRR